MVSLILIIFTSSQTLYINCTHKRINTYSTHKLNTKLNYPANENTQQSNFKVMLL